MSSQKPSWIGQTLAGRYKIETLLGQGGMSAVYKATDPNLRRTVAIKLIHPHLASDEDFVRRFEEEAAAVASGRSIRWARGGPAMNAWDTGLAGTGERSGWGARARIRRASTARRSPSAMRVTENRASAAPCPIRTTSPISSVSACCGRLKRQVVPASVAVSSMVRAHASAKPCPAATGSAITVCAASRLVVSSARPVTA